MTKTPRFYNIIYTFKSCSNITYKCFHCLSTIFYKEEELWSKYSHTCYTCSIFNPIPTYFLNLGISSTTIELQEIYFICI